MVIGVDNTNGEKCHFGVSQFPSPNLFPIQVNPGI